MLLKRCGWGVFFFFVLVLSCFSCFFLKICVFAFDFVFWRIGRLSLVFFFFFLCVLLKKHYLFLAGCFVVLGFVKEGLFVFR